MNFEKNSRIKEAEIILQLYIFIQSIR
jgi:hypothetical protein